MPSLILFCLPVLVALTCMYGGGGKVVWPSLWPEDPQACSGPHLDGWLQEALFPSQASDLAVSQSSVPAGKRLLGRLGHRAMGQVVGLGHTRTQGFPLAASASVLPVACVCSRCPGGVPQQEGWQGHHRATKRLASPGATLSLMFGLFLPFHLNPAWAAGHSCDSAPPTR